MLTVLAAFALASCASMPRTQFTEKEQSIAGIPGMPNVRFYSDAPLDEIQRVMKTDAMMAAAKESGGFRMLAISGGGYDGAYGAGILNGWTQSGKRPDFVIVSGVSAGAMIAPLAFLGQDYDPVLKRAFTGGDSAPIGDGTDSALTLMSEAGTRRETLHALISSFVDDLLLRQIAVEHKRGRRLLVVTTNLDAQRAVVWNMGAIAASGHPKALQLFRDVLTASCGAPGMFEPTRIKVTASGRAFEELHVDGGITTNVFALPDGMLADKGKGDEIRRSMYVIMNTRLTPEFQIVDAQMPIVMGRAVSTLLKAHSKAALQTSIEFARSHNIDFNLTHMNMELPKHLKPSFSTDYMRAVYDVGYRRASKEDFWEKSLSPLTH